ncbi:hypothetical protein BaRGS_00038409 [Batillaria attramentaria]|uniref:Uncharacterized protein n=2 Tax=Batillaria attramentaria TaxID=370345 RepID=A0ABD0J6F0_9CAEN
MEKPTAPGQNLFFRGGIDHSRRTGCTLVAEESNCSIPIEVRDIVELPDGHVAAYRAWSQGDRFLDWYGPEEGQGNFNGHQAQGTPATWTTNDQSRDGYHPGNEFGDNYWLLDMDMDCSKTENGYFELKGFLGGQWEGTISDNQCEGVDPAPFTSTNHIAMCGALNIFHWNEGRCQILVAA